MKVTTITCPECGYTIFSRTVHDFRSCFCGKISIDGGSEYVKVCFHPDMEPPTPKILEIPQTPIELYQDWNERKNVYGLISPLFTKEGEIEKS